VKATTDGVVRDPSALGMTVACPPSMAAITEFVVPRSIPTALAIRIPPRRARGPDSGRSLHQRIMGEQGSPETDEVATSHDPGVLTFRG